MCVYVLSHTWLFAGPWTVACQAHCPWKFQGKNTDMGFHFVLQGDPGMEPPSLVSPALRSRFFTTVPPGKTNTLYSVQFSHSVVSDSLWPHESQHARPPCPSPTPRIYPNPCPSSRWCHPAISSSVVPFSSYPQSLPASGSFPNESTICTRWPKYWGFSFIISPSNEHAGLISFRMDWLDLLAVQGTLKSLLEHYSSKASIFRHSAFFTVQLSHPSMTTGKTIDLTRWTFVENTKSFFVWLIKHSCLWSIYNIKFGEDIFCYSLHIFCPSTQLVWS